jgi:hypothetical protein
MDGIMVKKSILDDIIVQNKNESASKEDEILKPLLAEVELIKDESIKSFVRSVLVKSNLFWNTPAGHNLDLFAPDEMGPNGNALHTKRMARISEYMCKSYSVTDEERDCVLAACLLHGVSKFFEDLSGNVMYDDMYAYTSGLFIMDCIEIDKQSGNDAFSSTLFITEESVQAIMRLIRCHMGPWSPVPETFPITYLDYIVHLSHNISLNIFNVIKDSELVNEKFRTI